MKAGRGSQKGAEFERRICKRLSLWVSEGARDDLFWRTSLSGGRATLQLRQDIINRAQAGDMTAIDPEGYALAGKCLFEYKFYKRLRIAEGLFKRTGEFHKFWYSTVKAAKRVDKIPILVARQNFFPTLLVCPEDCDVFPGEPVLQLCRWRASVYNFDEVTAVRRKLRRRG